jgi:predicted alternative tryptophan synthase beta-subunit
MANINTQVTAAESKTQMEAAGVNPETVVGGEATGGQNVFITLRFTGGRTIKPKEIYEMVDAKYGTVAAVNSSVSRGTYIFNIEA